MCGNVGDIKLVEGQLVKALRESGDETEMFRIDAVFRMYRTFARFPAVG